MLHEPYRNPKAAHITSSFLGYGALSTPRNIGCQVHQFAEESGYNWKFGQGSNLYRGVLCSKAQDKNPKFREVRVPGPRSNRRYLASSSRFRTVGGKWRASQDKLRTPCSKFWPNGTQLWEYHAAKSCCRLRCSHKKQCRYGHRTVVVASNLLFRI